MTQILIPAKNAPYTFPMSAGPANTDSVGYNLPIPLSDFDFSVVPAGYDVSLSSAHLVGSYTGATDYFPAYVVGSGPICSSRRMAVSLGNGMVGQASAFYNFLNTDISNPLSGVGIGAQAFDVTLANLSSVAYATDVPLPLVGINVTTNLGNFASPTTGLPVASRLTLHLTTVALLFDLIPTGSGGTGGSGSGTGIAGDGTGAGMSSLGSDPSLCQLKLTRGNFREAIRGKLGVATPLSRGIQGAVAGEEPAGEPWPGNQIINQAIADAIRELNRRTGFHSTHALSVQVAAYKGVGPQWIPLQGIGAGPWQNLINDVQRAIWDDGYGTLTRLRTRSFDMFDRSSGMFDSFTADTPREFGIHAYEMGLLPGSARGGTLHLWAGVGLIGFCSDTDVMDELSLDEQAVIEDLTVKKLRLMKPDEDNAVAQIELYGKDAEQGIKDIRRNLAHRSAQEQSCLTVQTGRRRRWV